ncbi:hypothetical protein CEP53_014455 [Fusarium sp. AF-6]|nr:hypothetical protein CEP53_014455 [Fusarium sp. AF-6]
MEGPPSARGFRPWVWEKPGSVMNFESISEEPGSSSTTRPPTSRTRGFTTSSGRQTVRWPFHSFTNSRSSIPTYGRRQSNSRSIPHSSGSFPRRAAGSISRSVSTVLGSDIIPDYVVHFIRGETPESLARKHRIPESPEPSQFPRARDSRVERDFIDEDSISPNNSRPGTPRAEREKMLMEERPQAPRSLMAGWRGGVAANVLLALLILVASIICLALAAAKGHISTNISSLMEGKSTQVEGIGRGILAVVNIFGIILIAGANYVFQILSSPTRAEVDNAHENREWLDIGIPSVRNLSLISPTRATLSAVILVLAVISQVIYNGLIITSHSAPVTDLRLVSKSFIDSQDVKALSLLTRIEADECISVFDNAFQTDYRSGLIVTKSGSSKISSAKGSLLSDLLDENSSSKDSIDYCYAEPYEGESEASLNVNGPLLGAITLVNLVIVLALVISLALALTQRSFNPLVTLGDALASFLADPDPTTQDSCLITKAEVKKGVWGEREAKYWFTQSSRWYHVPSFSRWAVWAAAWFVPFALAVVALVLGALAGPKNPFSSFGKATVVYQLPEGAPRAGLAIIAALPQLLLGVLYVSTNALVTLLFLSHEFSQYSLGSLLPFRVSSGQPIGAQTTSLYLTLPRPVSWLLFFMVTAMAFFLSQGVFLVSLDHSEGSTSGIGFSPLPLLLLVSLMLILGLGVAGLSLRKVDPRGAVESGQPAGNPLTLRGGTCSAVLSARCHRVPRESGVEALEVRWGVVREGVGMNAGHATFSGRPVGDIMVGRAYA